jgi:hypothetical protein
LPKPTILETFNVEKSTAAALTSGGNGQGTRIGNMLDDTAKSLRRYRHPMGANQGW